jgi:WD40 repeat protein
MRLAPLLFFVAVAASAQDFDADLQPVFRKYCLDCHAQGVKMGSLDLETIQGIKTGGNHGQIIVPGNAEESRLYLMSAGKKQPFMPMDGRSLAPAELDIIKNWINAGAKGPVKETAPKSSRAIPDIKPRVAPKPQIFAMAQSADGTLVALAGHKTVRLNDAVLTGHLSTVRAVAFSKDGAWLAAAGGLPGQKGEVKLWNVAAKTNPVTINGHKDCIYAVAFSPDGKMVATASYDKMIYLWDTATGQQIRPLKDHIDAIYSLAFSPDGTRLLSASADRSVKVWDPATGERLFTLSEPTDALQTLAVSPNGRFVAAAGGDKSIRLWELSPKSGALKNSLIAHEDTILQLAFSPDGATLASGSADRSLKLLRTADLSELKSFPLQSDWPSGLVFSPDGKSLRVSRLDGTTETYPVP